METEPTAAFAGAESLLGDPATEGAVRAVNRPVVMLVESDAALGPSLAERLRACELFVELFVEGGAALRRTREAPRPAVIVLDVMLPELLGGVQFREAQMTSPAREIPVVAITGAALEAETIAELRFVRTFAKPVDVPKLVATVRELCGLR